MKKSESKISGKRNKGLEACDRLSKSVRESGCNLVEAYEDIKHPEIKAFEQGKENAWNKFHTLCSNYIISCRACKINRNESCEGTIFYDCDFLTCKLLKSK